MTISVVIADQLAIVRWALGGALRARGFSVVGEVGDAHQLHAAVAAGPVDVVLMHATLPPSGGMAACAAVRSNGSAPRVVLVSDATDEQSLLGAVDAGADGYLGAEASLDDCAEAIRSAHGGVPWIPPSMLGLLLRDLIERRREQRSAMEKVVDLSRREREILGLLADGLGTKAIAETLVVSPHTARTHVQNLRKKLGVRSRAEAVAFAERHDLLSPGSGTRVVPDAGTEGEAGD